MERNTMELISAAYTVYSLVNPADRVVVSIQSFSEAFNANLATLDASLNAKTGIGSSDSRLTEEKVEITIKKGFADAEETINDKEKLASLLAKLKQKMKSLPMVGSVLANVPTMFKLLNNYLKGEYTDIPRKDLIFIVSALSYLISPIDLIPDFIPVVGLMDDMAIVSVCIKSTRFELERYLEWRKNNNLSPIDEGDIE